jgi:serine/threonine-protein kinase RsbT
MASHRSTSAGLGGNTTGIGPAASLNLVRGKRQRGGRVTTGSGMIGLNETTVVIGCEADVASARIVGRDFGARAGLGDGDLTVIAAAIAEIAGNMLAFAGRGEMTVRIEHNGDDCGVVVIARDRGPGIADVHHAVQDGFSTSGRQGLGLAGSRRLMDEFEIVSAPEKGTEVTMKKWRRHV